MNTIKLSKAQEEQVNYLRSIFSACQWFPIEKVFLKIRRADYALDRLVNAGILETRYNSREQKQWRLLESPLLYWQIRFVDKRGCGSFEYVAATVEDAPKLAVEKANEHLEKERSKESTFYKPDKFNTIWVWELDRKTMDKKRGGLRFRLRLMFMEMKFAGGGKKRDEWYEHDISEEEKQML